MKYYETLYIVNPDLPGEAYQQVLGKFNGLVETNRGVIIKVDEWGSKPLAYPVKKFEKGCLRASPVLWGGRHHERAGAGPSIG